MDENDQINMNNIRRLQNEGEGEVEGRERWRGDSEGEERMGKGERRRDERWRELLNGCKLSCEVYVWV